MLQLSSAIVFIYSMMGLLIFNYEPFSQDVFVEYVLIKWLLTFVL